MVGVGYRRVRVMAVLAVLVMTAAGLAGLGMAGTAGAATAAQAAATGPAKPTGLYSGTPHQFPGKNVSGVTQLCGPAADYSCDTGGYAGKSTGWWGDYYGDGWASSNSYGYHNCTLYAAYRIAQNGVGDPGKSWGNAWQWAASAQATTPVDQTPAVGAVAQWTNHSGTNVGHVAYVEVVTASYIVISDDNYGLNTTDRFEIAVGSPAWPDNFIHFLDTDVGEIVHWNDDPSSPKAAWHVGSDRKRHWIPSESVYECMVSGPNGADGPLEMTATWLDTVAPLESGSTAPCGGDVNGDGIVNIKDLSIMASEWGHAGAGLQADINLDGTVSLPDLSLLAQQWGKQPSPVPVPLLGESIAPASAEALMRAAVTRSVPLVRPAKPAVVARPAQSDGVGDVDGNSSSVTPSVSTDGNLVAFSSFATNLVPNDENGSTPDVFAWNRSAGTITLVSRQSDGTQLTTPSEDAHISPNGRYVAFDSGGDVWVKDLQTGSLLRISQPNADPGAEPDQPAYADAVTSSGLVVFTSEASNLVTASGLGNGDNEVYARQLTSGPVELVSVAPDGTTAAAGDSFGGNASDNGRYIVFSSVTGNLTAGDANGWSDIFERDLTTGTTTMVSVPPGGGQSDGISMFPSVSADGSAIAFNSTATNLTAGGNPSGSRQVYVAWPSIGTIYQVSHTPGGTAGNDDSTEPTISGDGTRVAFRSSATNLVPGDTNYSDDVFVSDLASGQVSRVSVSAGLGQANDSSFGPAINGDGSVVTFPTTASNIGPATSAARAALPAATTATPVQQVVARSIALLPQNPATATITGTAKVASTLTAHAATWEAEGTTLSYQWSANGTPISHATGKTLTLTPADYGKTISVTITSREQNFATATATSRRTGKVAAGTLSTATPTIKGTVKAGSTLTAVPGTWKPSGVTLHYQWYVNGKAVSSGGTSRTLKLSTAWADRTVTVKVTGTLNGYATAAKTSKPTGKITR
jgi:surface antigen